MCLLIMMDAIRKLQISAVMMIIHPVVVLMILTAVLHQAVAILQLVKDCKSGNPHKEVDWGEDVGRERIWSLSDEEYEKRIRERYL